MKKTLSCLTMFTLVFMTTGIFPLVAIADNSQNQDSHISDSHDGGQQNNDNHDNHDGDQSDHHDNNNDDHHDNGNEHHDGDDDHGNRPTDVCPNIDDVQATIPDGMHLVDGQCVPVTPPTPSADLSITKIVDNATPDLGSTVVYTITVTNNGTDNASNVVANDILPAGVTYVSDDSSGAYNSGTGLWTIGTLANGQSKILKITVTVNSTDTVDQSIPNVATVSSDTQDPNSGNNTTPSVTIAPQTPVTPPTDVCPNIDDTQATVPDGMHLVDGQCVPVTPPTDVCPNIDDVQTEVPDGDSLIDGQCVPTPVNTSTSPETNTQTSGGGNGPIVGSFGGGNGPIVPPPHGQVLGASCSTYLTSYLGMGKKNDPEQVKKLQIFLNEYLHLNIPVTGFFGIQTFNAVKQFQIQEGSEVLAPWVKKGLLKNNKDATGYVYKTTLRRINLLKCSELDIPVPQLP